MVEAGLRTTASMFASIPASGTTLDSLFSAVNGSKPQEAACLGSLQEASEPSISSRTGSGVNIAALTGTQSAMVSPLKSSPRPQKLALSLSYQPPSKVRADAHDGECG